MVWGKRTKRTLKSNLLLLSRRNRIFFSRKVTTYTGKDILRQAMKKRDKNIGLQLFLTYLVLKFKDYGAMPLKNYFRK